MIALTFGSRAQSDQTRDNDTGTALTTSLPKQLRDQGFFFEELGDGGVDLVTAEIV